MGNLELILKNEEERTTKKETIAQEIVFLWERGYTFRAISKKIYCDTRTIKKILRLNGLISEEQED